MLRVCITALLIFAFALWRVGADVNCTEMQLYILDEGDQVTLTCTVSPQKENASVAKVAWKHKLYKPTYDILGSCFPQNGTCSTAENDVYALSMDGPLTTELTVKRDLRTSIAGSVLCEGYVLEGDDLPVLDFQHLCFVRSEYPRDKVKECAVLWNSTDWSLSSYCNMVKILPSDGQYGCGWKHQWKNGVKNLNISAETNKGYHSVPVGEHAVQCRFDNYKVKPQHRAGFFRFWIRREDWILTKLIHIEIPGEDPPKLSTTGSSCPTEVMEGSNLTCQCLPPPLGHPRPVVTWERGRDEDGGLLRLSDVRRPQPGPQDDDDDDDDGYFDMHFTCHQYWGSWLDDDDYVRDVTYTVRVYPPSYRPKARPVVIAFSVIGGLLLAVALVIVVIVIVKRRRDAGQHEEIGMMPAAPAQPAPTDGLRAAELPVNSEYGAAE
ncbi:uncharacterized protein LOC143291675 [Babylonia areolata]|uniref:uncharacterized protein LOC143291675 n=1 Tax=Babylonia areolata TaxID=304850 RepID=UPI003FD13CF4